MGAIGAMDVDAIPGSLIDRARHIHSGCFYLQETSRDRLPGFFASVRARGHHDLLRHELGSDGDAGTAA